MKCYNAKWTAADNKQPQKQSVQFKAPQDNDEHLEYFTNFFEGGRNIKSVFEDPIVGFVQRFHVLLLITVTFRKKAITWNPEKKQLATVQNSLFFYLPNTNTLSVRVVWPFNALRK
jgi:hypothetical protein